MSSPIRGTVIALMAALFTAVAVHPVVADVTVGLTPASQTVAPGSDFTLELRVTQPGADFNGFDALVSYDPAALTFVPTAPTSLQQGSYMTSACGNTFHHFRAAGDSLSITVSLLCAGVALPGPGQLYVLHFHASSTAQVTHVRLRSVQFYNAGLFVNPAVPSDAIIGIGTSLDVPSPARPRAPRLSAMPNPFHGRTVFAVETPEASAQRLEISDLQGRLVRRLQAGEFGAGQRRVDWDGRDDDGRALPPGVYRVTLRSGSAVAVARIAMIR